MGRSILFSVLLSATVLMGTLPITASMKGWRAFLAPFVWVGANAVIWSVVGI